MAKITYKLSTFDAQQASSGKLCVMVSSGFSESSIANGGYSNNIWTPNTSFNGAGICRVLSPSRYLLIVDSVQYTFNNHGEAVSTNASGWKLMMGEPQVTPASSGNYIDSSTSSTTTRGGETPGTAVTDEPSSLFIDNLNARDQFASNILKGMLSHIEDPSVLSDNEIAFYCDTAYRWAAYMMSSAANARSTMQYSSSGGEGGEEGDEDSATRSVDVNNASLESNTEKLLYNLVAELEKTNRNVGTAQTPVYAERVCIPELISWLTHYTSHTEGSQTTTVGLYDLIQAIRSISSGSGEGSSSGNVAVTGWPTDTNELIVSIGGTRGCDISRPFYIGNDANHPIHISGGAFPTKSALAAEMYGDDSEGAAKQATSFVTFNNNGAVGWMNLEEIIRIQDIKDFVENTIRGLLNRTTIKVKTTINGTTYDGVVTIELPSNAPEITPEETEQGGE